MAETRISELEQAAADRHLTDHQREVIRAVLKGSAPLRITISYLTGVKDSPDYAKEFALLLNAAGWNVTLSAAQFGPDTQGLLLYPAPNDRAQQGAFILQAALKQAGIKIEIKGTTADPTDMLLEVGTK